MQKRFVNYLLAFSIVVFIFGVGYKLGEYRANQTKIEGSQYNIIKTSESKEKTKLKNVDFSLFWDVWESVEKKYVDKKKLDPNKMFYGAIKGMVASIDDPYTFFMTPEENKQSKDDLGGKFEGIGAQLGLRDNTIIIVAPLKNSPAEKSGVRAGDIIKKVDGQSTKNWTLTQTVNKIRGTKGTKVKLTLERNQKEFDVDITRDQINVSSVDLSFENKLENKVAILKLNQFGENTNKEWDEAVSQIKNLWDKKQIKGMILDLRDNPGGYLDGSVYLASEFLPLGKVIVRQESSTTEDKTYYVLRNGQLKDIPMVILINKGSASASEILSGALRDYKRATLVGEKSFGKGSVQEALDIGGEGAGLHVTVAKWILPNGDWINSKGIEPEVKAELKLKDGNTLTRENDNQLDKALEVLLK